MRRRARGSSPLQLLRRTGALLNPGPALEVLSSVLFGGTITIMSDHIYKKLELVGSSPDGFEGAVKNALTRASKTIRNMRWFEVTETRGHIEDGKVDHWQVTLKVGFTLE